MARAETSIPQSAAEARNGSGPAAACNRSRTPDFARMKVTPLVFGCALLLLGGCATLSDSERAVLQRQRVPPALQQRMDGGRSLEIADVIELSRRGVPPDLIIRYMRSTGRTYSLSSLEVVKLRDAGVRPGVIDYMLATPSLHAPRYVEPWWGCDPYYYSYYHRPVIVVRGRGHRR